MSCNENIFNLFRDVLTQQQFQKHRVGNYYVFAENFERIALPTLNSKIVRIHRLIMINGNNHFLFSDCKVIFFFQDVLFIDEIGKMELFSEKFVKTVKDTFFGKGNKGNCIIATIPQIHKVPQRYISFFEQFYEDSSCKVIDVNRQNRDNLPQEISITVSRMLPKV